MTWASTYTLAFRLTGNEEDALDVAQETYLRAFRGLPRFRGEARFSTWLYRVTANCASNHLSRSWRSRHDQLDLDKIDEAERSGRPSRARPRGVRVGRRRAGRAGPGPSASCPGGCARSWCCATSTTSPTSR